MSFKPAFGTPLNRDHPLSRGLVAAYLFNENSGRYVWDATGNGNDGICTSMADPPTATSGWGPGPDGGALVFDGTNDYVEKVGGSNLPTGATDPFSLVVRVRAASYASLRHLFGFGNTPTRVTGATGVQRAILTFNNNYLFWGDSVDWDTGIPFDIDGLDHSAVFTADASNLLFYRDGLLRATTARPAALATAQTTITAGKRHAAGTSYFAGSVEGSIYNRALSAAEVAWLYAEPYCMFEEESYPAWMIAQFKADWLVRARRSLTR